jgi:chemotaxis protein histidine kinase CheA
MGVRKLLEENFDYEIVDEFLDHFSRATDEMEVLTINLEKPEYYVRNVDELFRIFHNIKSATAYLKIDLINKFAVNVEDLLELMRKAQGPAPTHIVDWLLTCDDLMSKWNSEFVSDGELTEVPRVLQITPSL